ncbi:calcium-transporting ATPase [Vairimorpha necatrix]|uniref:Calcium-transporting ATPase n=1 Tax=Vairimorpha necatrix TaxID=6039 RepID=A0AAX4JCR8_9MICR
MRHSFYKQKAFYKRSYIFPMYLLPILIGITKSYHIIPLFTTLFSIFFFLLTCWSDKFKILFTMVSSNTPSFIFYNGKLCKIQNSTFLYKKSKFFIENKKIIKLSPNITRNFSYYISEYKNQPFVDPKYLKNFQKNFYKIDPPKFVDLFCQHATTPFFVFQIFCGILWCLDEYIYQSLFTIIMLIIVEAGLVYQRIITLRQFRTMNHKNIQVELENGEKIDSVDILPGQIIKIKECIRIPCDLLIKKGSCAVNEAILTGESIPLIKEDISEVEKSRIFDIEKDKKHVLFAGTDLIKIDNNFVECFVLKTGFDTVQGELIKKMMTNDEITVNDVEAYGFIGMLLFFAIISATYTCREGLKMGKTGYKIFLECILIITNVVPTELPLELSMAVNACVAALKNLGIFCLEPFRIPFAGKVNVCCFDKTGTLTETVLNVQEIHHTTAETVNVLRTCHTLIKLDNKLTGDPLETAVEDYINKIILQSNNINVLEKVKMPNQNFIENINKTINTKYNIKKKYLFSSELKRMTVVYEKSKDFYVSMKGAPETVKNFLKKIPDFYEDYKKFANEGFRVIALAHKKFLKRNTFVRQEVEENMDFAGFILFDCKIKDHAFETIRDLKDSGHKVLMITGDNLLTALTVATKLGIINKNEECGVEGNDINEVLYTDEFEKYLVFARADPKQKEKIVEKYNKMGFYTLMCGDGTNDVGALKSAHVGVALLEPQVSAKSKVVLKEQTTPQQSFLKKLAEEVNDESQVKMGDASVAAPFTAKTKSLECILNIIRQGRSALVTTIQMYKILALNSLVNAFSLSVLDCMGIRFSEYQLVASGMLVALAFTFLTKNVPLKEISSKRPLTTIFNKYIMSSIFLQVSIHIISFLVVLKKLKNFETLIYEEKFKPSLTNTALFLLSTTQQVSTFLVNYIGRPFRESLMENKRLLGCLTLLFGMIFYLLLEINEEFNSLMEVVPLGELKTFIGAVIILDVGACFLVERMCFNYLLL